MVDAYPLTDFLAFIPATSEELMNDIFCILHPKGKDSIAPMDLEEVNTEVKKIFDVITFELLSLREKKDSSVVVLRTLFNPSDTYGMICLDCETKQFVNNEKGLAYLFYKKEISKRTIKNGFVLFNAKMSNRSQLSYLLDRVSPRLYFPIDRSGGFDCNVSFAFVT